EGLELGLVGRPDLVGCDDERQRGFLNELGEGHLPTSELSSAVDREAEVSLDELRANPPLFGLQGCRVAKRFDQGSFVADVHDSFRPRETSRGALGGSPTSSPRNISVSLRREVGSRIPLRIFAGGTTPERRAP